MFQQFALQQESYFLKNCRIHKQFNFGKTQVLVQHEMLFVTAAEKISFPVQMVVKGSNIVVITNIMVITSKQPHTNYHVKRPIKEPNPK